MRFLGLLFFFVGGALFAATPADLPIEFVLDGRIGVKDAKFAPSTRKGHWDLVYRHDGVEVRHALPLGLEAFLVTVAQAPESRWLTMTSRHVDIRVYTDATEGTFFGLRNIVVGETGNFRWVEADFVIKNRKVLVELFREFQGTPITQVVLLGAVPRLSKAEIDILRTLEGHTIDGCHWLLTLAGIPKRESQ